MYAAGILIGMDYGNISNAYSTGTLTSSSLTAGGLVGYLTGSSTVFLNVSNVYSSAAVIGGSGLFGRGRDINLYNSDSSGNVTTIGGSVGGLIGYANSANVYNSYATGTVLSGVDNVTTGAYATLANITYASYVGGLIGQEAGCVLGSCTIQNSFAKGNVSGGADLGGLVGYLSGNWIVNNSYSTGKVTSYENTDMSSYPGIGGLIGYAYNTGTQTVAVTNSYATGDVVFTTPVNTTIAYVGGLVGDVVGNYSINSSHATGNVTGNSQGTGGLLGGGGSSSSVISNSYATGNVTAGAGSMGGLAGSNQGQIINSYSTGNVTGLGNPASPNAAATAGGLVGNNIGSISGSYTTGNVSGLATTSYTGGIAGANSGIISNSYSDGLITGVAGLTGGIVSMNTGGPERLDYQQLLQLPAQSRAV